MKQSPMPRRRTRLAQGTGLKRGAGLQRRVPLAATAAREKRGRSPRGSVAAAVALVLAGTDTVAAAARVTGADPQAVEKAAWETVKRLVMERDSHTCLATGGHAVDVHHRVPRGMGGTADPKIAFGMANLVALTRAAHDLAHKNDDPEMASKGFRLESWQDPAEEPVTLFSESGGTRVWLTAGQDYALAPPARAGAA